MTWPNTPTASEVADYFLPLLEHAKASIRELAAANLMAWEQHFWGDLYKEDVAEAFNKVGAPSSEYNCPALETSIAQGRITNPHIIEWVENGYFLGTVYYSAKDILNDTVNSIRSDDPEIRNIAAESALALLDGRPKYRSPAAERILGFELEPSVCPPQAVSANTVAFPIDEEGIAVENTIHKAVADGRITSPVIADWMTKHAGKHPKTVLPNMLPPMP